MFLRLGFVVGQTGLWMGSLVIIAANVVTTITALSMCAICTNGEVKGGGAYFLISRALGPVFGGTIGILFYIAQAVATSLYIIGFAESIMELGGENPTYFTGDYLNDVRVIGLLTSVLLLCVALVGIGWYARAQVGLLAVLVVAMLSVIIGSIFPDIPDLEANMVEGFVGYEWRNSMPDFSNDPGTPTVSHSFFTVFAVFFPAVTGIFAGANISGDLKDPSSAIPKGTLGAIALTSVSYIVLLWIIGLTCLRCVDKPGESFCPEEDRADLLWAQNAYQNNMVPNGGLLYNKLIMRNLSFWEPLVFLGVFSATLSSALASLVGAPRILQSVASDKLFPWAWFNYFGYGKGASKEPVPAYFLTFMVCCAGILIGKLDSIAPLISNFFMITYAMTNYACFAASMTHAPGWRPSFKFYNKWLSLFGAALCVVVMFLMDWTTTLITLGLCGIIFAYLTALDPEVNWGAAGEARKYVSALKSLESLAVGTREHVKTYRPQFLVMSGKPIDRPWLVKFASMLQKGYGAMIVASVVMEEEDTDFLEQDAAIEDGDTEKGGAQMGDKRKTPGSMDKDNYHLENAQLLSQDYHSAQVQRTLNDQYLNDRSVWAYRCPGAFAEVVVADSVFSGFKKLFQTAGLGNFRPNAVMLGYKYNWLRCSSQEVQEYEMMIRTALAAKLGVVIVRDDHGLLNLDTKTNQHRGVLKALEAWMCGWNKETVTKPAPAAEAQMDRKESTDTPFSPIPKLRSYSADSHALDKRASLYRTRTDSLKRTVQGDTIDVWWLTDDGGFTMLLPHILRLSKAFSKKKLRVFTITGMNAEDRAQDLKMIHLLQKFRIEAEVVPVDGTSKEVSPEVQAMFSEFETAGLTAREKMEQHFAQDTLHIMRYSTWLRKYSSDAAMTFVTLPVPVVGMEVRLYMAWLECLTRDMPPMGLLRGNNVNTLTFFS